MLIMRRIVSHYLHLPAIFGRNCGDDVVFFFYSLIIGLIEVHPENMPCGIVDKVLRGTGKYKLTFVKESHALAGGGNISDNMC